MREDQIVIEPFAYMAILDLRMEQEVNEHAKASVTLRIKEENQTAYAQELMKETWVKIELIGEEDSRFILFYGIVEDASFSMGQNEVILKMELRSGSVLLDGKKHFRTFQDSAMTCDEAHQLLAEGYQNIHFICEKEKDKKLGHLWIQYEESDWAFLKRLASANKGVLVPYADHKGICYNIGIRDGKNIPMDEDMVLQMEMDKKGYRWKSQNGLEEVRPRDCIVFSWESRENHKIGDYITYFGKDHIIYRIESRYEGAECVHTYYCKTKRGLQALPMANPQMSGASFDAAVLAVERDRVKIELEQDENRKSKKRKWFTYATVYSSPDGTGWYCMPEIGDQVRLYIPEEKECNSFVISSTHMEQESARQNPDHKSLKNKYGKEILLTPSSIIMTNNNGMRIELTDQEGIFIESDKMVEVAADGDLHISSRQSSLLMAAQDKVQIKQGTSTMLLEEDISFSGGEFRIQ